MLVGTLVALCWTLIKMLLTEKDKRVEDAKSYKNDLAEPIASIGKTLERIEEKTIVAKERR